MTDAALLARIEALERAMGLPRRVQLLRCETCFYEVAELSARHRKDHPACPRCGMRGLAAAATVEWPQAAGVER